MTTSPQPTSASHSPAPFLSIVIPAYNEEKRLPGTLEQIFDFLNHQNYEAEVLVVENGSNDHTLEIARKFAQDQPNLRVLQSCERGKGLAVKLGMLAAHGEYRFMCDADLSMPISEVNRFLPPQLSDYDVVIGSREASGARRYNEPAYRHLGGRGINLAIRVLALPGLNDSQCGFKCFRAHVAQDLFSLQTMPGWSFDVEILYIARRHNYRIIEIGLPWYYNPESKLNALQDAFSMIRDILTIRKNARLGIYDAQV